MMEEAFNLNLGCVIYSKSKNGLDAEWLFSRNGKMQKGIGKAIRITEINEKREFEGEYEIIYVDTNGKKSPKLHLEVLYDSEFYSLTWKIGSTTTDVGIGFERNGKLLVSYKKFS